MITLVTRATECTYLSPDGSQRAMRTCRFLPGQNQNGHIPRRVPLVETIVSDMRNWPSVHRAVGSAGWVAQIAMVTSFVGGFHETVSI